MPGKPRTGGDIDERQRADIAGQVARGSLSIQDACARHQLSRECIIEWVAAFRHSSLTAFDEQLYRTLAKQGVDVRALATAEFQGDLGELTLADLIQTLALGRRDGVITVWHDGRESRIWCVGGEVADAESGKLVGVAAAHRMLALEHGRVRASFTRVSRPRRVHVSTVELLLDGARRSDECSAARRRLGSGLYRLASRALSVDDGSTEQESAVLRHFDAPLGIPDALAVSELGDLETLTIISGLVARQYLLPDGESSIVPSRRTPLQAASSPPIVMSLANGLAQRGAHRGALRLRVGLVIGLGVFGLATWLVPRSPSGSRARGTASASAPTTAAAQWEPTAATPSAGLATLLPREAAPGSGVDDLADVAPVAPLTTEAASGTSRALARAGTESRRSGRTPSARRRAPRGSAADSPSPGASVQRVPPPHADAAEVMSLRPRMQLIEDQARGKEPGSQPRILPRMQIVE